jgi:hypothetical protein
MSYGVGPKLNHGAPQVAWPLVAPSRRKSEKEFATESMSNGVGLAERRQSQKVMGATLSALSQKTKRTAQKLVAKKQYSEKENDSAARPS